MEKSLFFNGGGSYSAEDFAEFFASIYRSGVNTAESLDSLKVTKGSGMQVLVADGKAMIKGRYYECSDKTLTIAETTTAQRIDRVVLRLNGTGITAVVKQGSDTTAPSLQRDNDAWELSLATITILAGSVTLTTATVTDDRENVTLCGILSFLGQPPVYPSGQIPELLWLYANFPDELSPEQIADVEANTSLMEKWNASRQKGFYNFVAKRNATGEVQYVLEGSVDAEQNHNFGAIPGPHADLYYDLATISLTPSYKKRFFKASFDHKAVQGPGEVMGMRVQLVDVGTGAIITDEPAGLGEYLTKSVALGIPVVPGVERQFKLRAKVSVGTSGNSGVTMYCKNFKVYMEDKEDN